MTIPPNLGKWLIETAASNDELWSLVEEWNRTDLNPALIDILTNWNEVTVNQTPQTANWLIWTLFGDPFFLQHEQLSDDQLAQLIAGCERVTMSIPRLHEPDQPMENGFFMLWDLMDFDNQSAIDTLAELLDHADSRIQYAALHGLGHRGDSRIRIIEKYIEMHPDMRDDEFICQCLNGTVM